MPEASLGAGIMFATSRPRRFTVWSYDEPASAFLNHICLRTGVILFFSEWAVKKSDFPFRGLIRWMIIRLNVSVCRCQSNLQGLGIVDRKTWEIKTKRKMHVLWALKIFQVTSLFSKCFFCNVYSLLILMTCFRNFQATVTLSTGMESKLVLHTLRSTA